MSHRTVLSLLALLVAVVAHPSVPRAQSPIQSCSANAEALLVRRRLGRSCGWLAAAASLRSDGAQRHGREQPAARGPGRRGRAEARRQRHRCRGDDGRGVECRGANERGSWRRPLRDHLRGRREEAVRARRERESADRSDAGSHEGGGLHLERRELGTGVWHAGRRDPDRHGTGFGLGMGRRCCVASEP